MKNWLEWSVFVVSLALVSLVSFLLLRDVFEGAGNGPDLQVELGAVYQASGGYVVPVKVINRGKETAEGVLIEVESQGERAEVELQYVPRESKREAWVVFDQQPENEALKARVHGYEKP